MFDWLNRARAVAPNIGAQPGGIDLRLDESLGQSPGRLGGDQAQTLDLLKQAQQYTQGGGVDNSGWLGGAPYQQSQQQFPVSTPEQLTTPAGQGLAGFGQAMEAFGQMGGGGQQEMIPGSQPRRYGGQTAPMLPGLARLQPRY